MVSSQGNAMWFRCSLMVHAQPAQLSKAILFHSKQQVWGPKLHLLCPAELACICTACWGRLDGDEHRDVQRRTVQTPGQPDFACPNRFDCPVTSAVIAHPGVYCAFAILNHIGQHVTADTRASLCSATMYKQRMLLATCCVHNCYYHVANSTPIGARRLLGPYKCSRHTQKFNPGTTWHS